MNILVNGKEITTNETTLYTLKRSIYKDAKNVITIADGFQTADDLSLCSIKSVVFIEKGVMPTKQEMEYMLIARNSPEVYSKVKVARVAVAGLGGLGSAIAIALARTGVGNLHLIDFDTVEPSNLNRQQYKIKHLGMYKTEALKAEISEINPYINVEISTVRVTEDNIKELFKNDNIVCEAFDNKVCKAMLVNTLLTERSDIKLVSGSGMAGYKSSNTVVTKKITSNFYLCGDGVTGAELGMGLMAPRVGICAGHQANMVLRLILNETEV